MVHFEFGKDKLKWIRKYNNWIWDVEVKMKALNIANKEAKLNFIVNRTETHRVLGK